MKTRFRQLFVAGLLLMLTALCPRDARGQTPALITTFTNPTPASGDAFGWSIAAVGDDRVLIGALLDDAGVVDSGAAYLFRTNGTLLTPFLNPTPAVDDEFGQGLAVVGSDRIVITAPFHNNADDDDAGAAYVFSTNGTLLLTLTNPLPAVEAGGDFFGYSVAAVGNDRLLIGANRAGLGASQTGAAYLYHINGTLLTTITNPTPGNFDIFGCSVAGVGSDKVVIGAANDDTGTTDAGAAYLFNTNGILLTTFTNPTPANGDAFGLSVAGLGNGGVLVGAPLDDAGAQNTGAVYLFHTNGTLLKTITNPTPALNDQFGLSIASMGNDRILIGCLQDDLGETNAGAVYLFSTNGTLINHFVSPTPVSLSFFGVSVAALGNGQVLVGAQDDTLGGGPAVGAAYLFSIPPTPIALSISLSSTNTVIVSWPSPATGWTLQQNTNSVVSANWSNVSGGIQDDGTTKSLVVNPPSGSRFYRLYKP